MSGQGEGDPSARAGQAERKPRPGTLSDWRIWLGLAVTVLAIYWTLHDVSLSAIGDSMARANIWLILAIVPCHLLGLWVRALRWRYLTAPISDRPLPIGALYRATAVGFMTLNVFPLRIGELIRPWFLSRETGVRGSAALGTLLLERALDFTTLLVIGVIVLYSHTKALPAWVRAGASVLAGISVIPFAVAFALRRWEEPTLALISATIRLLPPALADRLLDIVIQVCHGLNALRGGHPLAMISVYSILLWGAAIAAPFWLGIYAFDMRMGGPEAALAAYTALVFTALAVAAPSAPGFFGVYHFACREALTLFGIPSATAVAYGTLLHISYWIPVTIAGFLALGASGARMGELLSFEPGKGPSERTR